MKLSTTKKTVVLDCQGRLHLTLSNSLMFHFVGYTAESKRLKDYMPNSSASSRRTKLSAIMTGHTIWEMHLCAKSKCERYSNKPTFKIILSKGEAAALLVYMDIYYCGYEVLHHELMQLDQFI